MTSPLYPIKKYSVYIEQTPISFEEDFCGVACIETDESLPINADNTKWSSALTWIVKTYLQDAAKIRSLYPNGLSNVKHLDFSNLDLITLPPHILLECKAARSLDISGNNIGFLPTQLKKLRLKKLDVSRNKGIQCNFLDHDHDWLRKMPKLQIVANDIGLHFMPRGWEGRLSTNQLPSSYDPHWDGCPTQCSSDEGEN